ncbi:MAG: PilZ domain-containing protein [Mariprofundaceae bacterium]|nr:PilZ domain-containing protein [Mariprofundaceae bacterium]
MIHNERDFMRVMFSTCAEVDVKGTTLQGGIRDVSMGGIFLCSDADVSVGDTCEVRIYLCEQDPLIIHALGIVARRDEDGLAVNFTGLYCDSYSHLKQVVLSNSEQAETAEKELDGHLGIVLDERQGSES